MASQTSILIDSAILTKVQAAAESDFRSPSAQVRHILAEWAEKNKPKEERDITLGELCDARRAEILPLATDLLKLYAVSRPDAPIRTWVEETWRLVKGSPSLEACGNQHPLKSEVSAIFTILIMVDDLDEYGIAPAVKNLVGRPAVTNSK